VTLLRILRVMWLTGHEVRKSLCEAMVGAQRILDPYNMMNTCLRVLVPRVQEDKDGTNEW
jgi:hypothetical protein